MGIVILTYNSQKFIKNTIISLINEKEIIDNACDTFVYLVDNTSTDNTVDILSKFPYHVTVNSKNVGFSKAVNSIIKKHKHDYYLLLNPDTELLPGSIKQLLECSIQYNASIVGGKHLKMDLKGIHGTAVTIPNLAVMIFDYTNMRKLVPLDLVHKKHYYIGKLSSSEPIVVGAVSGGFMLIKGELFKKIGYLDENFFMYLEDVDFCSRANDVGEKVMYCPESQIRHFGGGSSDNKYRTNLSAWKNSRRYYAKKHFSGLSYLLINAVNIVDEHITNIFKK